MNKKIVPLYLTFFRIILVLPILICIFFNLYWLAGLLWLLAGFTDFLDGYLSRKWSAQSTAGALLDPVADKILVISILVILCYFKKVDPFLVILFTARDIYITGLRSVSASQNIILYAKSLAKWKTTLQIAGVFIMLMGMSFYPYLGYAGYVLLWICVIMSWVSAWSYTKDFTKKGRFIEF